jgi:hypothetical protein
VTADANEERRAAARERAELVGSGRGGAWAPNSWRATSSNGRWADDNDETVSTSDSKP